MSALPAAVQAQVERANQLVEQLNQPAEDPNNEAAPSEDEQSQTESPVENAADEGGDQQSAPTDGTPAESQTPDWEHKYNVLQGKYNAEVPRLNRRVQEQDQELTDMRQRLTNTETLLASLNRGRAAEGNDEASASPPRRLVKDEEIQEFGPDLYDFIQRAAEERLAAQMGQVTQTVEQRVAKAEQTAQGVAAAVAQSEEDRVIQMLFAEVPQWTKLNEDQEFLTWLNQRDPFSGQLRGEMLSQAFEAHDGPRVVAFFKGFLNENAVVTPQPPAPPAGKKQPEGQSLEGLVAPGTPKAGPQAGAPNEAGKRVWTQPDITALYARINEFTKKGKAAPKELQAQERDLIAAQAEGRIQI